MSNAVAPYGEWRVSYQVCTDRACLCAIRSGRAGPRDARCECEAAPRESRVGRVVERFDNTASRSPIRRVGGALDPARDRLETHRPIAGGQPAPRRHPPLPAAGRARSPSQSCLRPTIAANVPSKISGSAADDQGLNVRRWTDSSPEVAALVTSPLAGQPGPDEKPWTCVIYVESGLIRCQRCGPTRDIVPFSTVNSWGSPSIEYARRMRPTPLNSGSRCSAARLMERT